MKGVIMTSLLLYINIFSILAAVHLILETISLIYAFFTKYIFVIGVTRMTTSTNIKIAAICFLLLCAKSYPHISKNDKDTLINLTLITILFLYSRNLLKYFENNITDFIEVRIGCITGNLRTII